MTRRQKRDRRAARISQADWRAHGGGAALPDDVLVRLERGLRRLAHALNVDPLDPGVFDTTARRMMTHLILAGFDFAALLKAESLVVVRPSGATGRQKAEIAEAVRLVEARPRGQSIREALRPLADATGRSARTRAARLKALQAAVKWARDKRSPEGGNRRRP